MKNVKVILIGVALCATVFANARIAALGGDAGFWSGDRANAAIFPGTLNDANWVEFGGVEGDPTASINWGDGTKWGMNFDSAGNNDWVNMSWAKDGMGLAIGFASTSDGNDATDTDVSGFDVAWGSSMSFGELGVGYNSTTTGSADAVTNLWANWRGDLGFWVFDQAKANFVMGDNNMGLGFDLFTHVTPSDGVDILLGWGFGYASADDTDDGVDCGDTGDQACDNSSTDMWLPNATLAVEANMTDWATVRAFVSQDYKLTCDSGGDDCGSSNSTDYGFGVGFGWQATNGSSVNLDMEVSNSLFVDPISTMGGWDDGNLANGAVTLSYTF